MSRIFIDICSNEHYTTERLEVVEMKMKRLIIVVNENEHKAIRIYCLKNGTDIQKLGKKLFRPYIRVK